jgi:hypothetical protein
VDKLISKALRVELSRPRVVMFHEHFFGEADDDAIWKIP